MNLIILKKEFPESSMHVPPLYASGHPELFQDFLAHLPIAAAMLDCQGRYLAVSRRWLQVYQLEDPEIIGHLCPMVGQNVPLYPDSSRGSQDTSSVNFVSYPWRQPNGDPGGLILIAPDQGNPEDTRIPGDVSPSALSSPLSCFPLPASFLDQAAIGIAYLQLEGEFLSFNQALCNIVGYTDAELRGLSLKKITHPEDQDNDSQLRHQLLSGKIATYSIEKRYIHKKGSLVWVNYRVSFSQESLEHPPYLIAIIEEINSQKVTEIALKKAHQELERRLVERSAQLSETVEFLHHEIAHRKQAETALQQERSLFTGGPVMVFCWIAAPYWPVEYVSPNVIQLGYQATDFTSGKILFTNIIHPADVERVTTEVQDYSESGATTFEQDYRILTKDGQTRWVYDFTVVIRNSHNEITKYEGYILDVTDRKRVDAERLATTQKLSLLVQQTSLAMIEWSTNFKVMAWNPAAERIFGYSAAEAMGRDGFELVVSPSSREQVSCRLNELLAQRGGYHGIDENKTKQGRLIVCEWYNTPLVDGEGHLMGIASLALDITERIQAEAALRKSKALYRTLVDNFPNGAVCLFDRNLGYILAGGSELIAAELTEEFLEGKTVWDVFPHGFCEQLLPAYQAALAGTSSIGEIVHSGQIYSTHTLPLKNELGDVSACMVMAQNITDRKRAELALQQTWSEIGTLAQREELINRLTNQIRQSLDLDSILETTVQEIRSLFQIDRCQFLWYRTHHHPPVWDIVKESHRPDLPSHIGVYPVSENNPFVENLLTGIVYRVDDTTELKNSQERDILLAVGYGSVLSVPLQTQSGDLGIIACINCEEVRPWGDSEVELLEAVGAQVSIAINQAELYEQTRAAATLAQAQAQQQALINLLGNQIRQSLDLEEILATTVHQVQRVLRLERCNFAWYHTDTMPPTWEVVQEAKSPELSSHLGIYPVKDFEYLLQSLLEQLDSEEVIIDDMTNPFEPVLLTTGDASRLNLPIYTRSGDLGVLACIPENQPYPWQDSEVELLRAVGGQLAIAIEQARLYKLSTQAAAVAEAKSGELEAALQELRQTQSQLIQNEKMSSLGQMVAGIAHEINNPVGFIYGNIDHAQEYAEDLLELVHLYGEVYPNSPDQIQSKIEAMDLEFIGEDLPKVLNSMKVGAERIGEIVRSLKNFSRLDEAQMKPVDIHTGIDSTLMILNNRIKARSNQPIIDVIKDYGKLPLIECYAGQLNQVFMNLISNAIDALEIRRELVQNPNSNLQNPTIWIQTKVINSEKIAIHIIDNGSGMSEAVRQKIFDPFFTTKPVGKGTGLGLSISYQIVVEKHQGSLRCASSVGQGTEFVIEIPMTRPKNQA